MLLGGLWGGMKMSFAFEPNQPPAPTFQTQVLPEETIIQRRQIWHFWQMLQVGLSAEKVTELIGEPLEKETSETACIWYYQQAPQRLPSGLDLVFSISKRSLSTDRNSCS